MERKKVVVRRVVWITLFIISVFLMIFLPKILSSMQPKLQIVDSEIYIQNYYSSLNQTTVEIKVTFNREVKSGYVTISYYDASNNFLQSKRHYLFGYSKTATDSYETINGKVDSYEITSFEFEPSDDFSNKRYFAIIGVLFSGIFLLASFSTTYKERYYNGLTISVYAGYFHHRLRINGVIYDEHNTLTLWTPIYLSTALNDGTKIDVVISLSNRSTIKVNGRLL